MKSFVALVYAFLYLPILIMVIFSFNNSPISVEWSGFTFEWYKQMFYNPELLYATRASLIIAITATILSISIATALVYAAYWFRPRTAIAIFSSFAANIVFPELILAIGLLSLFSIFGIPLGYGSIICGHILLGLGFAVPIIRARFKELDPKIIEASLDLGATQLQTFFKVILPLLAPALIGSGLLVFTLSLDDFLIAFFCSSPKVQTLSVYVYSLVREGVNPTINAISTCLLFLSSLSILALSAFKIIDKVVASDE